jgi:hypothetical protein
MKEIAFVLLVLFWALIVFIVMGIIVLINDIGPKVKISVTEDGGKIYIRKGLFYKWKIYGSYADPMMASLNAEELKKKLGTCF